MSLRDGGVEGQSLGDLHGWIGKYYYGSHDGAPVILGDPDVGLAVKLVLCLHLVELRVVLLYH